MTLIGTMTGRWQLCMNCSTYAEINFEGECSECGWKCE